jgi:hypothetical protein
LTYDLCGLGLFLEANDVLIRNFPSEMLLRAPLLEILLEENGPAGISHKCAGGRQEDVASAVLHLNPAPKKSRIAGHTPFSFRTA